MTETVTVAEGEYMTISEMETGRSQLKWRVALFRGGTILSQGYRATPVTAKTFKKFVDSEKALLNTIGKL